MSTVTCGHNGLESHKDSGVLLFMLDARGLWCVCVCVCVCVYEGEEGRKNMSANVCGVLE